MSRQYWTALRRQLVSWFGSALLDFPRMRGQSVAPARRARKRQSFRPELDTLELRLVPTTWTVTNAGSSGAGSLAAAVASANADSSPATINFNPTDFASAATITLASTLTLSNTSKPITINGSGAGPITISGGNAVRVFAVDGGVTATIEDLTIAGGATSANGGGIDNAGTLTLIEATISGNTAASGSWTTYGGGVFNSGSLNVLDSTISGNTVGNTSSSYGRGGGIANSGTLRLENATVTGNLATTPTSYAYGGGVYNSATATLTNCTISGNTVYNYAQFNASRPPSGDQAYGGGGGICNVSKLTVAGCAISDNLAYGNGGGIRSSGSLTLLNSTISGNTALTLTSFYLTRWYTVGGYGGAVSSNYSSPSKLSITASTIAANSAYAGGGLFDDVANLNDTIVAQNSATYDKDILGWVDGSGASADNLIGDGNGCYGITNGDAYGNQVGTSGSPIDPDLGSLQNNGGPTDTMALGSGSPALGAGGAITTVSANATTSATMIYVANAATIASTPGDYLIMIDGEEMEVTNVNLSTNALTVTRAMNGQSAAPDSGDPVYLYSDQRGVSRAWSSDIGAFGSDPVVSLADPGTQADADSDTVYLPLSASDSAGNAVAFSATGLPAGLSINSSTGAISGTLASGDDASSPYSVTVTATDADDANASASQAFTWTVSSSGTITVSLTASSNQTNTEQDTPSLSLSATDSASNALIYSASNLPLGLSINPSTGEISGAVNNGDFALSPYTVRVWATDSTNASVGESQTFQWTINPLVTVTSPGNRSDAEGDSVDVAVSATDSAGDALTYNATGLPAGLSIASDSGIISGTISSGAHSSSPYSVLVTATDADDGSASASQSFTWTVSASGAITVSLTAPSNQTNFEGDSPTLTLSATDSASNALVYTASNLPAGLSINASTGVISGTVSNDDSDVSPYIVTVTATDSTNASVASIQSFEWTINPLVTLTSPGSLTSADSDTVFVPLSATDSAGNPLTFTASGLPTGLSMDADTGIISGTISGSAYTGSPYSVTVTATDAFDASSYDTQTFSWTVNSSGTITVTMTQPLDETNSDGASPSLTISAMDSASNSLVYAATGLPAGLSINSSTGVISGTITSGDSAYGVYEVTVSATDNTNATVGVSKTFQWTVNPVVTLSVASSVADADGESVNWTIEGSDSGSYPMTYSATGLPAGLSINAATGVISGTMDAGDDASSPYSVVITATDAFDASATASETISWTVHSSYSTSITLTQPSNQLITAGTFASLSISALSSVSNPITYTAIGLPPGMSIDPSTGVISGTPYAGDGNCNYTTIVTATDAVNTSAVATSTAFTWAVAQAPAPAGFTAAFGAGSPSIAPNNANTDFLTVQGTFAGVPRGWRAQNIVITWTELGGPGGVGNGTFTQRGLVFPRGTFEGRVLVPRRGQPTAYDVSVDVVIESISNPGNFRSIRIRRTVFNR